MYISKITLRNFRCWKEETIKLNNSITAFIGKNDVGKSSILHALDIFFNKGKVTVEDFSQIEGDIENPDYLEIGVAFKGLPETVELVEKEVETTLQEENLLNDQGELEIIKRYHKNGDTEYYLNIYDYEEEEYRNLCVKKQNELLEICSRLKINCRRSGRGIKNKDIRKQIREAAEAKGVGKKIYTEEIGKNLFSSLKKLFPTFILYPVEVSIGEYSKPLAKEFQPLIVEALDQYPDEKKNELESFVEGRLNNSLKQVQVIFNQLTEEKHEITPNISFNLSKSIEFDVTMQSEVGLRVSPRLKGAGIRRLLMTSVFRYLGQKRTKTGEKHPA